VGAPVVKGRIVDVPIALLERYAVAAPRYTSYPTAVDWRGDLDAASYPERLARAARAPGPVSIYVHVPFCETLCLFCGCNVVITRRHDRATAYLDHLEREIAAVGATGIGARPVSQLHWGGGTPTFLSEDEMRRLDGLVRGVFRVADDAEVAIEVDPRHTTRGQVRLLAHLGFNRLSAGVQDFDARVQEAVHRVQSEEETRAIVAEARDAGFRSINLDLIWGLPYQTLEGFERTLDAVLDIRPERIALFGYAHVPWIRKHQDALPADAFPAMELRSRIFVNAVRRLGVAGYETIGLDHFALPSDELAQARRAATLQRNFMGYTTRRGDALIPLGVSSIGEVDGAFVQNPRDVAAWSGRVHATGHAVERGHVLDADDRLRRAVIMQMMCLGRVDVLGIERAFRIRFSDTFAEELRDLAAPEGDGLVTVSPGAIEATALGRFFLRNLALPFDRYLRRRKAGPEGLSRTFSRTV
jgi:oxygen-independent coproporphyrinogen-3 oxidase